MIWDLTLWFAGVICGLVVGCSWDWRDSAFAHWLLDPTDPWGHDQENCKLCGPKETYGEFVTRVFGGSDAVYAVPDPEPIRPDLRPFDELIRYHYIQPGEISGFVIGPDRLYLVPEVEHDATIEQRSAPERSAEAGTDEQAFDVGGAASSWRLPRSDT